MSRNLELCWRGLWVAKLSPGGPVGKDFGGQRAQNVKCTVFWGPEGQMLPEPWFYQWYQGVQGSQGAQVNDNTGQPAAFLRHYTGGERGLRIKTPGGVPPLISSFGARPPVFAYAVWYPLCLSLQFWRA